MSMYRPYSNVCFNNCYDFIMKSKAEKEVWELSTSLTFDDEEEMRWELDHISDLTRDIMNAEYDLCEMEMNALYDAEEYDNILNGNVLRKGRNRKAQRNGKRNADKAKRLHKADRYHGKHLEPYLYKEDGVIKESIEDIWKRCRYPVSDKAHYHSALKADAREEEFYSYTEYLYEKAQAEAEAKAEAERKAEENFNKELDSLSSKGDKFLVLVSYWDGETWQEYRGEKEFQGIFTFDEVKKFLLSVASRKAETEEEEERKTKKFFPTIATTEVFNRFGEQQKFNGTEFRWGYYYYEEEPVGYDDYMVIPLN